MHGVGMSVSRRPQHTPGRVRSLIAIGAPTHKLAGAVRTKVRLLKPIYRTLGAVPPITAAMLDALLAGRTRRNDPAAVEIVASAFRASDRRGMSLAMQSFILDRPDLHDESRAIEAATLFVATDDRGEWTPAEAEAEVGHMRNATLVTLHGPRALAALESPDAVAGSSRMGRMSIQQSSPHMHRTRQPKESS